MPDDQFHHNERPFPAFPIAVLSGFHRTASGKIGGLLNRRLQLLLSARRSHRRNCGSTAANAAFGAQSRKPALTFASAAHRDDDTFYD